MSALGWVVTSSLGVLGLGGAAALLTIGLGPIGALFAGATWIKAVGKIVGFLFGTTLGRIILGAAALAVTFLYGHHLGAAAERVACEARIEASIKAAQKEDARIASELHAAALEQAEEAKSRLADQTKRIDEYARTHQSCSIGAAGAAFIGSLSDGGVQPGVSEPAGGSRRDPGKAPGTPRPSR